LSLGVPIKLQLSQSDEPAWARDASPPTAHAASAKRTTRPSLARELNNLTPNAVR
jgi:hypothetical protein